MAFIEVLACTGTVPASQLVLRSQILRALHEALEPKLEALDFATAQPNHSHREALTCASSCLLLLERLLQRGGSPVQHALLATCESSPNVDLLGDTVALAGRLGQALTILTENDSGMQQPPNELLVKMLELRNSCFRVLLEAVDCQGVAMQPVDE